MLLSTTYESQHFTTSNHVEHDLFNIIVDFFSQKIHCDSYYTATIVFGGSLEEALNIFDKIEMILAEQVKVDKRNLRFKVGKKLLRIVLEKSWSKWVKEKYGALQGNVCVFYGFEVLPTDLVKWFSYKSRFSSIDISGSEIQPKFYILV